MKFSRIGFLAISAICLTPAAHAEQHGAAYAAIKAAIDYCERVDERHRQDYANTGALALATLAGLGDTGDSQGAYDAVSDALNRKSERTGRAECAAALGLPNTPRDDDR